MGVGELRDSFNAAAPAGYACNMALLDYQRVGGREWQILTFRGTDPNGGSFELQSGALGAGTDLNGMAAEVAKRLIKEGPTP